MSLDTTHVLALSPNFHALSTNRHNSAQPVTHCSNSHRC